MKSGLCTALAAVMPVCALSGQATSTGYFPPEYQDVNGNVFDNSPFSWSAPQRSMLVYDREIYRLGMPLGVGVPVPDGKAITKIGFRKEETIDSPSRKVVLQIWMAKARPNIDSTTVSYIFDDNYEPGTEVKVYDGLLDLPALTSLNPIVWVTLQTPYIYDASRGLVVDFRVTQNSNGNLTFDYFLDLSYYQVVSPTAVFGNACPGSGGQLPNLMITPTSIGTDMQFILTGGSASSLAVFHLNVEKLPAPITAPAIAGPCELWVNPLAAAGAMTDLGGTLYLYVPIPNDLTLYGLTIYSQVFIPDFFANTLGVISSNGAQVSIGTYARGGLIRQQGDSLAPMGNPAASWALIAAFEWMN